MERLCAIFFVFTLIYFIFTDWIVLCFISSHLISDKGIEAYESRHVMRNPAFCICENKDGDQLHGNREADQRLCFRYIDSTITLLPKSEISSHRL